MVQLWTMYIQGMCLSYRCQGLNYPQLYYIYTLPIVCLIGFCWLPSVCSQVRVSAGSPSVLAWSLYKCAALWRTVYGPSATERPLGTIR